MCAVAQRSSAYHESNRNVTILEHRIGDYRWTTNRSIPWKSKLCWHRTDGLTDGRTDEHWHRTDGRTDKATLFCFLQLPYLSNLSYNLIKKNIYCNVKVDLRPNTQSLQAAEALMQLVYRLVVDGRGPSPTRERSHCMSAPIGVRGLHLSSLWMLLVNFVLYIIIYRTKLIVRVGFKLGTPTPEFQRLNDCSGDHYGNASLKIRVCVLLYYSLRVFIYCIKYRWQNTVERT